jgi:MEDS: MEthanogen/methylotroph, DcmR Sensory domain
MEQSPRHHCLVYEGAPSRHLPVLAPTICEKLRQNYRCLYLNSPTMVAGMRSYLAAEGLDVQEAVGVGALVLSSDQHLKSDGQFDTDTMLQKLGEALDQALADGHRGLWASGDMTWEFGPARNFSGLLEYERRLEEFFHANPELIGVCQYHADTLPRKAMRQGLLAHPSVFINQTMTLLNPHYILPESTTRKAEKSPEVELSLSRLLQLEFAI